MTVDLRFVDELEAQFQTSLPSQVPGRTLHIDGDILAYLCAGNDDTPFAVARRNLFQRIENVRLYAGAEFVRVHITSPTSDKGRRYEIAVTQGYQEQRTHSQRPKNWQGLREVLEMKCHEDQAYVLWEDREADDGMNAEAWESFFADETNLCVITSNDKDLRQSPGWYLDWNTNELLFRNHTHNYRTYVESPELTEGETASTIKQGGLFHGAWFLLWQMLYGDGADNIPGVGKIPGDWLLANMPQECSAKARAGKEQPKDKPCGPALAAKILGDIPQTSISAGYKRVQEVYRAVHGHTWVDYFKEQWQLLCLFYFNDDDRFLCARDMRDGKLDWGVHAKTD